MRISVPPETLNALLKTKPNEWVSAADIKTDENRIADYIGYNGVRATVRETPVYAPDQPGVVQMQYEVEEEQVAHVGRVYVVGNTRTLDSVAPCEAVAMLPRTVSTIEVPCNGVLEAICATSVWPATFTAGSRNWLFASLKGCTAVSTTATTVCVASAFASGSRP